MIVPLARKPPAKRLFTGLVGMPHEPEDTVPAAKSASPPERIEPEEITLATFRTDSIPPITLSVQGNVELLLDLVDQADDNEMVKQILSMSDQQRQELLESLSQPESEVGRPSKHTDSAEKQKAYRARQISKAIEVEAAKAMPGFQEQSEEIRRKHFEGNAVLYAQAGTILRSKKARNANDRAIIEEYDAAQRKLASKLDRLTSNFTPTFKRNIGRMSLGKRKWLGYHGGTAGKSNTLVEMDGAKQTKERIGGRKVVTTFNEDSQTNIGSPVGMNQEPQGKSSLPSMFCPIHSSNPENLRQVTKSNRKTVTLDCGCVRSKDVSLGVPAPVIVEPPVFCKRHESVQNVVATRKLSRRIQVDLSCGCTHWKDSKSLE
jgi:hypothetical protein